MQHHRGGARVVIQMSAREEARALPVLLRHSSGMVLPERIYIIAQDAARTLRESGVEFVELSREAGAPTLGGMVAGERI